MFASEHYLPLTRDWFGTAGGIRLRRLRRITTDLSLYCDTHAAPPGGTQKRSQAEWDLKTPPSEFCVYQGFPPSWTCCKSSKQYSLEAAAKLLQFLIANKNAQHPLGGIASSWIFGLIFSVTSQAPDDLTVDLIAADVASLRLSHSVWPHSLNKTPEYSRYFVNLSPLQEVIHYSQAESHVLKLEDTPFSFHPLCIISLYALCQCALDKANRNTSSAKSREAILGAPTHTHTHKLIGIPKVYKAHKDWMS